MKLGRLRAAAAALFVLASLPAPARAGEPIFLAADRDDDDADGVPDGDQAKVAASPELPALTLGGAARPARLARATAGFRVLVDGKPIADGEAIPAAARRVELQATRPGRGRVELAIAGAGARVLEAAAIEVLALDGEGKPIDLARSHASLQRTPPDRLADDPFAPSDDPDALRFVVAGVAEDLPGTLSVASVGPGGTALDVVADLALGHVPCPDGVPAGLTCGSTLPVRAVADDIDRNHPIVAGRSLRAELGGALVVIGPGGHKLQMIRVAGPRRSPLGPIGRWRARLRVLMVRAAPHGAPPMGGDVAGAIGIALGVVRRANAIWGACGISFGPPPELDVAVVDPPRSHLLALGCDHGLPASGGAVRFRVEGHDVVVPLAPGTRPAAAARAVAAAVARAAGVTAVVSDNPVIGAGAFGASDVLVRRRDGSLAAFEPPAQGPVSSDATLTACIGKVDLDDGLQHFGDVDAIAGTVEERTLLKAFDDGDPSTIEVLMVPSFAGGGRIGESFISADGGAVRNVVIEDRAGIRADRASFALAHEIGHVLLDDPGHPDDFGSDTPTRLMDADAANPSAYGPRRLLVDECVRAIRQSGPGGVTRLLEAWPLAALGKEKG